jgi:hypothetical protein
MWDRPSGFNQRRYPNGVPEVGFNKGLYTKGGPLRGVPKRVPQMQFPSVGPQVGPSEVYLGITEKWRSPRGVPQGVPPRGIAQGMSLRFSPTRRGPDMESRVCGPPVGFSQGIPSGSPSGVPPSVVPMECPPMGIPQRGHLMGLPKAVPQW